MAELHSDVCPKSASVQRERIVVRTTRLRVYDNSCDGSQPLSLQHRGSSSRSHLSHASTSRGHKSLYDAVDPEVFEAREVVVADSQSYTRGLFDTSLHHLYANRLARHT